MWCLLTLVLLVVMILSWSAKLRTQSSGVQEETFGQLLPFLFPLTSANQATVTLVCSKKQCLTRIPKTQLTARFSDPGSPHSMATMRVRLGV